MDNNVIVNILQDIKDPRTGLDLISMKMISDLKISGNRINLTVSTPNKDAEARSALYAEIVNHIKAKYSQAEVDIHFKDQSGSSNPLPQVKNIIAVASGKGGVGKSTVSVNLAHSLNQLGFKVGILDADLYGPSIPTMMGLQGERPKVTKLYGRNVIVPLEKNGIHVISIGFIVEPEQAVVLRGPRLGGIIKQFVGECLWPKLDYLIIDLPPGTGDIQLTMVQTIPVTGVVMVTTPQEVAVIDAVKAMNMFRLDNVNVPILGVIENMSWFTPKELPENKYYLFGQGGGQKLAKMAGTMVLGQIPIIQSVREGADEGTPAVMQKDHPLEEAFSRISKKLNQQVAIRHEALEPTSIVRTS